MIGHMELQASPINPRGPRVQQWNLTVKYTRVHRVLNFHSSLPFIAILVYSRSLAASTRFWIWVEFEKISLPLYQ